MSEKTNIERAIEHARIAEQLVADKMPVAVHKGGLAAAHATLALFYRDLPDTIRVES